MSEELLSSIRDVATTREGQGPRGLDVDDLKQIQRVHVFEQAIRDILEQERQHGPIVESTQAQDKPKVQNTAQSTSAKPARHGVLGKDGVVLTLFGNAPTPKQLFSSTQNPKALGKNTTIKSELPVEEMSLPTGLTATRVMPAPGNTGVKEVTFEETFAPPYNLPSLDPPKAHRRSTTRDTTIVWQFKDSFPRGSKKAGFTAQNLTVGEWISYKGTSSRDVTSSSEKRKQRERASSTGEGSRPVSRRLSSEEISISGI